MLFVRVSLLFILCHFGVTSLLLSAGIVVLWRCYC